MSAQRWFTVETSSEHKAAKQLGAPYRKLGFATRVRKLKNAKHSWSCNEGGVSLDLPRGCDLGFKMQILSPGYDHAKKAGFLPKSIVKAIEQVNTPTNEVVASEATVMQDPRMQAYQTVVLESQKKAIEQAAVQEEPAV